jgi:hypothetical protein
MSHPDNLRYARVRKAVKRVRIWVIIIMLQRELLRRAVAARVATSQEPTVLELAQWCVHGTPSATVATPCTACMASVTERPPRAVWGTRVALWPGCVQWGGGGRGTLEPPGSGECYVDLSHQAEGTGSGSGSGSDGWDTLASLRQALSGLNTLVSLQGLVNVAGLDLWFWDADSKRLVARPPWRPPPSPVPPVPPSQPSLPLGGPPAARAGRGPRRAACVMAMHTVTPAGAAAHGASPWRRAWVAVCLGGDVPGMPAMVSRGP